VIQGEMKKASSQENRQHGRISDCPANKFGTIF
jgi:hypothetical protein